MNHQKSQGLCPPQDIEHLFQLAHEGDAVAAQALFDRYAKPLLSVIRAKLSGKLRSLFDSEDFLQEGRIELFKKQLQMGCGSPAEFLALMRKVVGCVVLQKNRQFLDYQRQNLGWEVPLASLSAPEESGGGRLSAEEIALRGEAWQAVVQDQPPLTRQILELLRQGCTRQEASQQLHISEWKVRCCLAKMHLTQRAIA